MTRLVKHDLPLDAERPRAEEKKPAVGEWYWVDWTQYDKKGRGLTCATEIGSKVPASELLNVSAYQPGAEEWHAEQANTDGVKKGKKGKSK